MVRQVRGPSGSKRVHLSAGLPIGSNITIEAAGSGTIPRPGVFLRRKSRVVMDLELKRDAKSVIDRIVHLRDSL
jgi:hypothetical protein